MSLEIWPKFYKVFCKYWTWKFWLGSIVNHNLPIEPLLLWHGSKVPLGMPIKMLAFLKPTATTGHSQMLWDSTMFQLFLISELKLLLLLTKWKSKHFSMQSNFTWNQSLQLSFALKGKFIFVFFLELCAMFSLSLVVVKLQFWRMMDIDLHI